MQRARFGVIGWPRGVQRLGACVLLSWEGAHNQSPQVKGPPLLGSFQPCTECPLGLPFFDKLNILKTVGPGTITGYAEEARELRRPVS